MIALLTALLPHIARSPPAQHSHTATRPSMVFFSLFEFIYFLKRRQLSVGRIINTNTNSHQQPVSEKETDISSRQANNNPYRDAPRFLTLPVSVDSRAFLGISNKNFLEFRQLARPLEETHQYPPSTPPFIESSHPK